MKGNRFLFVCLVLLFVVGCSHKEKNSVHFVVGSDTLKADQLGELIPDAVSDSGRLAGAVQRIALAGKIPAFSDTLYKTFAEQLSLQTGDEWDSKSAALLYSAAEKIFIKSSQCKTEEEVKSWAESLYTEFSRKNKIPYSSISVNLKSEKGTKEKELQNLLCTILNIKGPVGVLLADYLTAKETAGDVNVKDMVKGIVFSGTKATVSVKNPAPIPIANIDNSELALKFRSQESIRDSIGKHIPDIRSLYKKSLKTDESLSGVVLISIKVDPRGNIIDAQVKKTDISDNEFLKPLVDYVKTIHFREIPEKIGNMTFEFPFEFNSEM